MDWLRAPLAEQGRAILAGLISPIDQAEAYLDAAAKHPYGARIYARMTAERARKEAVAAHDRARSGLRRSLLDGVAISWKDNVDTAGVPTEAGSRLLEGRTPTEDAEILTHAGGAGLVCLGKTHMTELAFSGLGLNPMTATPPNAYDPALAPGGSSSGAAVSVALGLAAAAIGTDTGGSIRLPAAWNGLVGFKPTHGAISGQGVVPLCLRFDTAGPIARTVEDCALLYTAMTRGSEIDLSETPNRKLRLLVLDGIPFDGAREAPAAAFEDAVKRIEKAGAHISRATIPAVAEVFKLAGTVFAPEAYGIWREQIEASPELMYPLILERFRGGRDTLATDYVQAWIRLEQLRRDWAAAVAGYDAVIVPTAPILPPNAEKLLADEDFFVTENLLALRNTRIGNFMGLPAITLPTGQPACGIMLMGRAGGDRALLVTAAEAEAALAS